MERRINRFIFRRPGGYYYFSRCKLQHYYRSSTTAVVVSVGTYSCTYLAVTGDYGMCLVHRAGDGMTVTRGWPSFSRRPQSVWAAGHRIRTRNKPIIITWLCRHCRYPYNNIRLIILNYYYQTITTIPVQRECASGVLAAHKLRMAIVNTIICRHPL